MGLGGGMVWAIGLDDFKNRCGDGPYPLLNVIKDVLTRGNDCTSPTTPTNPESSTSEQTSPSNSNPPPQTTTTANPTTAPDNSGPGVCRPTDIYASQPGMTQWCNVNCNYNPPNCPSSHCICGGTSTVNPAPATTTTMIPTTPKPNPTTTRPTATRPTTTRPTGPSLCRPTDVYASQPGMTKWCNLNCNAVNPYCPSTHCICGETQRDDSAQSNTTTTSPCADVWTVRKCNRVKGKGRCGWRWVQRKCPKTCNVCNN